MKSSLCVLSQKFLKDSSLLISYTLKKKKELVNGILSHFLAFWWSLLFSNFHEGNSLVVQWLGPTASTAGGPGSIPVVYTACLACYCPLLE